MAALHLYRVGGGVCRLGPGEVLALDEAQMAARKSRLEPLGDTLNSYAVVRSTDHIEFKSGETIGLFQPHDALPRYLSSLLEYRETIGAVEADSREDHEDNGERQKRETGEESSSHDVAAREDGVDIQSATGIGDLLSGEEVSQPFSGTSEIAQSSRRRRSIGQES